MPVAAARQMAPKATLSAGLPDDRVGAMDAEAHAAHTVQHGSFCACVATKTYTNGPKF